ncbi:MAG TPA: PGPGW domain-containing protein [Thermoanaerobaculia bacterium]|nr:PGPGW domain-containing protein [Thermoanaerobaculia bacterium]
MTRFERPPRADNLEEPDTETRGGELIPLEIRIEHKRPFPFMVRVGIFLLGWILILVGVAGLVLPGIQGVITIVAGAALLSLDNELAYRALHRVLKRWPKIWQRVERFREKAHDRIHRLIRRRG